MPFLICLMRKGGKSFEKKKCKVANLVPHLHIYTNYANCGRCHVHMNKVFVFVVYVTIVFVISPPCTIHPYLF